MSDEKTLDEALDEIDRWGEDVATAIENLSAEEVVAHFAQAQSRLEQKTGRRHSLPHGSEVRPSVA
jgi:hypothetical protein